MAENESGSPESSLLKPLTRRQKNGTLLYRPRKVELELARLLDRPIGEMVANKATISSQALAYVMRNLRPNRETSWFNALWEELERRVDVLVRRQVSGMPAQDAIDIRREVGGWFRELLFSQDDRADAFEAVFFKVVTFRAVDEIRRIKRKRNVIRNESDYETENMSAQDRIDAMNFENAEPSMPRGEASAELAGVWAMLTEKEREAVLAVHVEGLAIYSSDSEEMTASKKLNVSDRRVRQLLTNAKNRASPTGDNENDQ